MAPNDSLANLYDHANRLLASHEALLRDAQRNRPFYRALKKTVTRGCSVLDIGSGTGLWAIAAARMGAKRVVAIEREPLLAGLIKALARENKVADRVEVVLGDARAVQLGKDFDVIISETIGHLVFDEDVITIMIDARERFLKAGGVLIPASVCLRAAGAHLRNRHDHLPAGLPLNFGLFESLLLHSPVQPGNKRCLKIICAPADLIRVDLTKIASPPEVGSLTARWDQQATSGLNCFAVWVEATLTENVEFKTTDTASWSVTAYRIRPFAEARGDLELKLTLTSETNYWTAALGTDQGREVQTYSPATAAALLVASTRTDADVFGHFQRIGV